MERGTEDRSGVVECGGGPVPWTVVDRTGNPVGVVEAYLAELTGSDCSPLTVRAYAYDLLTWWRFLVARGVAWDRARRVDARDYVLELRGGDNPYRRRRPDSAPAGTVNSRTGKPSLAAGYAPATINHRLTVISAFRSAMSRPALDPTAPPSRRTPFGPGRLSRSSGSPGCGSRS